MRPAFLMILAVAVLAGSYTQPLPACADQPTVSITGRHIEYFAPDTIRVRCRIFSEGKSGTSAVTKLQAARKQIEARLATLKESPRTHIGEPVQMQEKPNENMAARMQAMVMGGANKKPKEPELMRLTVTI